MESMWGSWEQELGTHGDVLAALPKCLFGTVPMHACDMSDLYPELYAERQVENTENTSCVPEDGLIFDEPQENERHLLWKKRKILF